MANLKKRLSKVNKHENEELESFDRFSLRKLYQ